MQELILDWPACAAEVYATIGHNACLEARPSVVHFGGFTVGSVHEQRIRLCNTSSSSTRTQIVLPTTPYFKVNTVVALGQLQTNTDQVSTSAWRQCGPTTSSSDAAGLL